MNLPDRPSTFKLNNRNKNLNDWIWIICNMLQFKNVLFHYLTSIKAREDLIFVEWTLNDHKNQKMYYENQDKFIHPNKVKDTLLRIFLNSCSGCITQDLKVSL
jgi:DUF4097 and DUF4098 domain-containing protein YvlB